ncbi:hypothetical protein FF098_013310 [Parvularcula flava]|uniref:Lipoprotein n=1 Tax=Aquisalinus luteolus TaxID=1566827 RepID=A0A8J3ES43_9PROT|nr:hypothetical protein [Aquisalinus luteolus]NHK28894.1 hypothetical protein [Aquisalinus luteolus]GGH99837.1 hypothetical protein GCM10011355_26740 [Aquisalinus luteolus]
MIKKTAIAGVSALLATAIIAVACNQETSSANAQQPEEAAEEAPQREYPPKPQFQPMELQAQYQGPFEDTVIQRWRDPVDGSVCYLYIPAQVSREQRDDSPFLDYGSNNIGSISCITQQLALRSVPAQQGAPQQQPPAQQE